MRLQEKILLVSTRFKRDLKNGILVSVSKVEIGILLWPVRLWQLSHNFAIYFFILIAFETNLNVRFSMLSYLANLNMKKNVNLIHYIYEFPCIQLCFWIGWFCVKIECLDLKYSIKSQTGYNDAFITLRFVYFKSKCYRMKLITNKVGLRQTGNTFSMLCFLSVLSEMFVLRKGG